MPAPPPAPPSSIKSKNPRSQFVDIAGSPDLKPDAGAFRSLKVFNYRVWAGGAIVSNVGTWMQRIAQDWLVLTVLTHHNATTLGWVMALQFAPQFVFLPLVGSAADNFDKRKLLMATQAALGILALALGVLTVGGFVTIWHVFVAAALLGCVTAFDTPLRQTFVSELVGDADLPNAIALNSTSFNVARMVGPAIAGTMIGAAGCGWAFLVNAISFAAVLCSLYCLRVGELHRQNKDSGIQAGFAAGVRYVRARPDLKAILLMLFLIGTFGLNIPIFISTMSVTVFHAGASRYGLLMSFVAIGTVAGALFSARRDRPQVGQLLSGAAFFGLACGCAALMPNFWLFGLALIVVGSSALTFTNATNSLMQLSTAPQMRGRVITFRSAMVSGGTPIGAPVIGWVADRFGPRWAMSIAAASGLAAAIVFIRYLARHRGLRIRMRAGRLGFQIDELQSS